MNKIDILSLNLDEIQQFLMAHGEKKFRAKQIFEWLHARQVPSFEEMSNLSKNLRQQLETWFYISHMSLVQELISQEDGTRKYLFELEDGNIIESVYMPYHHGNSVCISSQVGCKMGCKFCASGMDGFFRNLSTAEMLQQIYRITAITGERISNVTVMGTGEPLDNYENLVRFIHMLTDAEGYHISGRNITVSTCGIPPMIRRLAEEKLQITLALSLHGATQEKRSQLMPIALRYPLDEVMEACEYYFTKTGRRMSYEYSLVQGVNDTNNDAKELIQLLKGRNCHVNLIPVNPVTELHYQRPDRSASLDFKNKLEKSGINVTIRREMGTDIDGACGQLRRSFHSSDDI